MKFIKTFCDKNNISYEDLEKTWIEYSIGNKKQLIHIITEKEEDIYGS